jgi:hypothetical protein
MRFVKYSRGVSILAWTAVSAAGQASHPSSVSKISLLHSNPFQLQIHTTARVTPQSQVISNPERLIIDIPDAEPGVALHNLAVNRDEVKAVRVSLFTKNPLVTRIVVDLNEPQWYRIAPNASGFLVSLGNDAESGSRTQPTIGWVSAKLTTRPAQEMRNSFIVKKSPATKPLANLPKMSVQFSNGMLTIHSNGATLSEVLFEVQKQTGAEIAIPSGTERDRVAADFGPGPAGEVMHQLLNGSGLNFVVVGSETDPSVLRSVILSSNAGPADSPANFAQSSAPAAENIEAEAPDAAPVPEDVNLPPAQVSPPGQPPAELQAPGSPPMN